MGKVRTKTVKKSAKFLVEKYYSSITTDFQLNKRFCDEVALIPSKSMRNKIAGFVTHLAKRLIKGRVSGLNIDFPIYEENEKEIINQFNEMIRKSSLLETDQITKDMIKQILHENPFNFF